MSLREFNFDGIVGPTHNYGGLSVGNVASALHEGESANPREAALQGLEKMRVLRGLGVGQGVLPPHPRPSLSTLRHLGFHGSDEEVLAGAARHDPLLVRMCSSAAPMWAANAATLAPGCDSSDGRLHLVPANLDSMFHRSLEARVTHDVLRAIFADETRFVVHAPLPGGGQLADEGAANHTRLSVRGGQAVHLYAWGRRAWGGAEGPRRYPARQTLEASQAIARLSGIEPDRAVFAQQHPAGIDAGAFHTDVLAVGNESFLLAHELAFVDTAGVAARLRALLGDELRVEIVSDSDLPVAIAVAAYPFNSQIVTLPDRTMTIIAPVDSRESPRARAMLERVVAGDNPVTDVRWLDVRQSMQNGGGPACLRLRVPLSDADVGSLRADVLFTHALDASLSAWVSTHYRDRLLPSDLCDPALAREGMTALDELTRILRLGSVYDFQR